MSKFDDRLNKLAERNRQRIERYEQKRDARVVTKDTFYWIWGASEEGKPLVWGPFNSEEAANTKAFSELRTRFEVIPLNTRDVTAASRIIRAKFAEEHNIGDALVTKFGHKQPEE